MNLDNIRSQYLQAELKQTDLDPNPMVQLERWIQDAIRENVLYPNAATLSTVDNLNRPHSRVILIKDIRKETVRFYTDYSSQKGEQMAHNNFVSINFFWKEFDRQVRMVGQATKISKEESELYFQSRPKESQISATASKQSQLVNKLALIQKVQELSEEYAGKQSLPCPNDWGGYDVKIETFEFWQGRPDRLHDRFRYRFMNNWIIEQLSP